MPAARDMKNHVILCGYGLVGEKIAEVLEENRVKFIVIELSRDKTDRLRERGIQCINGDATSSRTLREAGIKDAKAIAIAMDNDAKNLFTVITARNLNSKIIIATRANDEFLREKLKDAGSHFVATPNQSASDELFRELTKGA